MNRIDEIVQKVRALRRYSAQSSFKTTKSQNDLLQSLDGNDLATALLLLDGNDNDPKTR